LAQVVKEQNRWILSGDITLQNVDALLAERSALASAKVLEVDLSGVTDVDTASISLLLEWLRSAMANGVQLSYSHLPANLISLATLYGVEHVIPQATHA
jgi:phospholipid transport system transporter-binding protein